MRNRLLLFFLVILLAVAYAKDEGKDEEDGVSVEVAKDNEEDLTAQTRSKIGKKSEKTEKNDKKGTEDSETRDQVEESAEDAASEESEKTQQKEVEKTEAKAEKAPEAAAKDTSRIKDDNNSKKHFGFVGGISTCNGGPPSFYPGDLWEYPYPYFHPLYNIGTAYCPCACPCGGKVKEEPCGGGGGDEDEKEGPPKGDEMLEKGGKGKKKARKQLVPSHYYGCPSAGWGGFCPGHTGGGWGAPYWYKSNIPSPDESAEKKFGISVHGDHDIGLWDHGWGAGYGHPWGAPIVDSGYYGGFGELEGSQYGGYGHGMSGWGAGHNIGLLGWGRGWGYPVNGDISGWGGGLAHGWGEGLHHGMPVGSYAWGTNINGHHPAEGWADTGHSWPEGIGGFTGYGQGTPFGHHGVGGLYKSEVPQKEESQKTPGVTQKNSNKETSPKKKTTGTKA